MQQQEVKLSKEEIQRYSRHLIMPEVGMEGQLKLKRARVLTIGTGGLGAPLGLYLAAADLEIQRYSRHLIMPEVGMEGQLKLKRARVLTIGTGGLGAPLGLYLAAAGV